MTNYWKTVLKRRVSRRRGMAITGATGAASVLLAACGGGDDSETTNGGAATGGAGGTAGGGTSGILTEAVDTSSQAKRGGTLAIAGRSEAPHLDALSGAFVALSAITPWTFGRLLELRPGTLQRADGSVMPGIAESWEWSGDGTELSLKLRPDVRFHPVDPVNGRAVDLEDVVFSWDRCVEVGQLGNQVNSVNPNGPILSLTTPDPETMVIKLTEPIVFLLSLLAGPNSGRIQIMPKEADGGYDPRTQIIGTGPFYQTENIPSVGMKFAAHPEYWEDDRPYVEAIDYPTIQEYSTGLSQFKAGSLHTFEVRADDVLSIKQETPDLDIYLGDVDITNIQQQFGFLPGSPFHDERVRQAASMSYNRDLWIDVVYSVDALRQAGLDLETRWDSCLPSNIDEGWWLDPRSSDFGENAKYFEHNLEEAKKLLAAAGYEDGMEVVSNHFTTTQFGAEYPNQIEIGEGMLREAGFKITKNLYVYDQEHSDVYRDARGQYEGYSYRLGPSALSPDPVARLMYNFNVAGGGFYGFDLEGDGDMSGDPYLEDLTKKARGEMDTEARRALVFDAQRHVGKTQYCVRWPGGASQLRMAHNSLRNFNVFRGVNENKYLWIEEP